MKETNQHLHLDNPTEEDLKHALEGRTDTLVQLYLETHRLVLKTLPGVHVSLDLKDGMAGYGARQYGYDGWGMASLAPYTRWVSLYFTSGASLPDPEGLLQGTGKAMRHVRFDSLEQLEKRRSAVRSLLEQAACRFEK